LHDLGHTVDRDHVLDEIRAFATAVRSTSVAASLAPITATPTARATPAATRSAPSTPATTGTAATTTLSLRLAARFGACSSLLILCHSLELQPALAGTVGHRLHAAVILVPRSIEHDTGNSRGPGPLRNRLAHGH